MRNDYQETIVKVQDFRGAKIDDLKYRLVLLLKKKSEHIILRTGTNYAVSKTSRQILDELIQLKQYIANISRLIVFRPTVRIDNGKAAIILSNFNKHLGQ